uniref:Uncharacterized protein n=1 Tax=Cryptosporidium parvum TaxID=5807 RepID=F0X533_CRYPV
MMSSILEKQSILVAPSASAINIYFPRLAITPILTANPFPLFTRLDNKRILPPIISLFWIFCLQKSSQIFKVSSLPPSFTKIISYINFGSSLFLLSI